MDTKKEIRSKLDHLGFTISKLREAKSRAVVIGCEKKQTITELKWTLADNLNTDEYTVEMSQLKKPISKIMGLNGEDIGVDVSNQDILDESLSTNSIAKSIDFYTKKVGNKHKNIKLIIETLSQERITLVRCRSFVYNHISILHCYKCLSILCYTIYIVESFFQIFW